jgi:hypothetical protein
MNPIVAQGGTAGAFALSFVVVLNGILTHFKIPMTPDVSNALTAMLIILIHTFLQGRAQSGADSLLAKPAPGGSPDFLPSKGPTP